MITPKKTKINVENVVKSVIVGLTGGITIAPLIPAIPSTILWGILGASITGYSSYKREVKAISTETTSGNL